MAKSPQRIRCEGNPFRASGFGALILVMCALTQLHAAPLGAQEGEIDASRAGALRRFDVVFVLDNSGSMRKHDPTFLTRSSVERFAERFGEETMIDGRIGIVLFDARADLALPLTPMSTASDGRDRRVVLDALRALTYSGQRTNIPTAVERALYELRNRGRADAQKAIVLLTDGQIDTGDPQRDRERGRWLREDLARESRAAGIQIFGIAFTDSADYQLIQALALTTDARYFRALDASRLESVVSDVLAQLEQASDYRIAAAARLDTPLAPTTRPLERDRVGPEASRQSALTSAAASAANPTAGPGAPTSRTSTATRSPATGWLLLALPGALLLAGGLFLFSRRRRRQTTQFEFPTVDPAFHMPLFENMKTGPPTAQLRDIAGRVTEVGATLSLRPVRTTVGRDAHNDIVLADEAISSEHALIERIDGRFWLEDRRSTNGTCLDGEAIAPGERVELKGGDAIRFADIDFKFILPGYTPGGDTVVLHHATAQVVDLDPQLAAEFDAPANEPAPNLRSELRECLDTHLRSVAALSPAFDTFVSRAFDSEIRDAIGQSAAELIGTARKENRLAERVYTADHIRYLLCAVPGEMDHARVVFENATDGFTGLLNSAIEDESFRRDRCEALAVLTFGENTETTESGLVARKPWVSLSIVPANSSEPRIDLLSYEFLSKKERKELEPLADPEITQSGLA